eukprot:9400257-Pyramimonas_sp.AAC.1
MDRYVETNYDERYGGPCLDTRIVHHNGSTVRQCAGSGNTPFGLGMKGWDPMESCYDTPEAVYNKGECHFGTEDVRTFEPLNQPPLVSLLPQGKISAHA